MAGETTTPNIGLQVPAFDQANWQVPTNYNWNLLDQIFGGEIQVPALSVVTLTAVNFTLPSVIATIQSSFTAEIPSGAVPGTVYTCSKIPIVVLGVYLNGVFQRPAADYTVSGNQITLLAATSPGDGVFITYLHN